MRTLASHTVSKTAADEISVGGSSPSTSANVHGPVVAIGRHTMLKTWRSKDHVGSSPTRPTSFARVGKWHIRQLEELDVLGSNPGARTNGDVAERQMRPAVDRLSFGATEVRVLPSSPACRRRRIGISTWLRPRVLWVRLPPPTPV